MSTTRTREHERRGWHAGTGNRWVVLAGGVLVQLAIGAVYAWSTFSKAIQADPSALELSKVQATIPFEVAIGMIFVGTFLGGRIQDRRGPRIVALVGVTIYSIGIMLASLARDAGDLWLLILGYGVLGGFGLGPGLHRADRHAAEVVPGQARAHHRHRRRRLRLRRRHHLTGRAADDRGQRRLPALPHEGLPAGSGSPTSSPGSSAPRSSATRRRGTPWPPRLARPGRATKTGQRRGPRLHPAGGAAARRSGTCSCSSSRISVTAGISLISVGGGHGDRRRGLQRRGRGDARRASWACSTAAAASCGQPSPTGSGGVPAFVGILAHPGPGPAGHPARRQRRRCSTSCVPSSTRATAAPSAPCRPPPATSSA